MGQYYKLCLLNSKKKSYPNKKKVAAYLESWDYGQGAKLLEFSWIGNNFVGRLEALINKESGEYAGYPVIVAGDYADYEPKTLQKEKWNIYELAGFGHQITPEEAPEPKHYRYVINEDKKVFIDCARMKVCATTEWEGVKHTWQVHPLTILCSDGCNGGDARGGGDYYTKHREVGAWRRNVVVVSDNRPDENEYKEVFYNFYEKF
jgi:hypothetical protein